MSRLAQERGYALTELLVALTLMLVITGATLTSLTGFERTTRTNGLQNEAQARARAAVDRLARDLRNQGSATGPSPVGVERAGDYDLVAQSPAPARPSGSLNSANSRRVRYCLDGEGRLWTMTQTWTAATPPAVPSGSACPGDNAAWEGKQGIADGIVNRTGSPERPLFAFNSAVLADVSEVRADLRVDVAPNEAPRATRVQSGVLLRNRNPPPTAAFTVTRSGRDSSGVQHVILNGSASGDPEGDTLSYAWYDGAAVLAGSIVAGGGVVVDAPLSSGTHTVRLVVRDGAGVEGRAETQVAIP